jgi:Predicted transcriptional regulator
MDKITLAQLRLTKNLSQREFARIIDVSSSSIAMYETGERTHR